MTRYDPYGLPTAYSWQVHDLLRGYPLTIDCPWTINWDMRMTWSSIMIVMVHDTLWSIWTAHCLFMTSPWPAQGLPTDYRLPMNYSRQWPKLLSSLGEQMIKFSILVWIFLHFSIFGQSFEGTFPSSPMICAHDTHTVYCLSTVYGPLYLLTVHYPWTACIYCGAEKKTAHLRTSYYPWTAAHGLPTAYLLSMDCPRTVHCLSTVHGLPTDCPHCLSTAHCTVNCPWSHRLPTAYGLPILPTDCSVLTYELFTAHGRPLLRHGLPDCS